jgi:hypothetical protein
VGCRDGAAKALVTLQNKPIAGGRAAFFQQFLEGICDVDRRCDGVCTFSGRDETMMAAPPT